jgi:hypothetical protein
VRKIRVLNNIRPSRELIARQDMINAIKRVREKINRTKSFILLILTSFKNCVFII